MYILSLPVQTKVKRKTLETCMASMCSTSLQRHNVVFYFVICVSYYITLMSNEMMSGVVNGLDVCHYFQGADVSRGRCFIFVIKYIMLTYISRGFVLFFCHGLMFLFNPLDKMHTFGNFHEGEKLVNTVQPYPLISHSRAHNLVHT